MIRCGPCECVQQICVKPMTLREHAESFFDHDEGDWLFRGRVS